MNPLALIKIYEVKYKAAMKVFTRLVTGTMTDFLSPIQVADLRKWVKLLLSDKSKRQCRITQLDDRYTP